MIDRLLDAAGRRVDGADALWRREERTSVAFESGRLKTAGVAEETGVNLRVLAGGRLGVAGTTAAVPDLDALVARARASAELGEALDLAFPAPSPPSRVATFFDRAATASLEQLIGMGRTLVERLAREGCQVNVALEREVSETAVGNTAGARGDYRATAVAVTAEVIRIAADDVLMVYDQFLGAELPGSTELDALVRSIDTRLAPALTIVAPPDGALPVVFTPAGLAAVLLPLEQALSGKAVLQGTSPLADRVGAPVFDPRFALTDDPLAPGRPVSRPVDDECTASRPLSLVERGTVQGFVYDLETAARAGTTSTGHGRRGIFGKPRIAYTNLIVGSGEQGAGSGSALGGGLLTDMVDGLLVDDLIGVGQGNVIGGAFSHPVALAYRVRRGEIAGRVKDAAVAGNAYELLKRIGGFGTDGRWLGSRRSPSLLLEGVSVARR
ncbi:MAG: TldD/PmbA family protein [Gemmatimonadales bacterium]